jgi:hypothetical protein
MSNDIEIHAQLYNCFSKTWKEMDLVFPKYSPDMLLEAQKKTKRILWGQPMIWPKYKSENSLSEWHNRDEISDTMYMSKLENMQKSLM